MNITIVGLGLIGGSLALVLKEKGIATTIIGVDNDPEHAQKALTLGIADEIADLDEAIVRSSLIILCVPVDACIQLLPRVLDRIGNQVVFDTGSVKKALIASVAQHPRRGRYVATHPMWGTEQSGPEAATTKAFSGRANVICDVDASDADALTTVHNIYEALGMYPVYMEAKAHDLHVAYISHISHITSFALANTVLEKEAEEDAIFNLASAGFESTVRLAKSNPSMWVPVLKENKEHVLEVLDEHIVQLHKFRTSLEQENWNELKVLMESANNIKRILNPGINNNKQQPVLHGTK